MLPGDLSSCQTSCKTDTDLPCAISHASFLGMAVGDMEFAYDDAAERVFPISRSSGPAKLAGSPFEAG